jgi:hypothetical protein
MLLIVLHLLGALAVALSGIPFWLICLLLIAASVSLFHTIHTQRQPSKRQVRKIIYSAGKGWRLFLEDHDLEKAELLPSTVSTRFCLFMHFRDGRKKQHNFMITRDAVPFDTYRQLRVILKINELNIS